MCPVLFSYWTICPDFTSRNPFPTALSGFGNRFTKAGNPTKPANMHTKFSKLTDINAADERNTSPKQFSPPSLPIYITHAREGMTGPTGRRGRKKKSVRKTPKWQNKA